MDALTPQADFDSLSLKDLLEAREMYHWHLMHKSNVIGTAVGRYLIRKSDPWPSSQAPTEKTAVGKQDARPPRTLDNSEVRPYSWPCVLVFVRRWVMEHEFGSRDNGHGLENHVPPTLYLPDGRLVPVCVVEAPLEARPLQPPISWQWPKRHIGGGFPITVEVQEVPRIATVGCLVTDGHKTYALTNRHVTGDPGTPIFTWLNGEMTRVGYSSERQLSRRQFMDLYPEFRGTRTLVNLDIGLIDVEDATAWTSQVYGIGRTGPLADVSTRNLSVRLIGETVVAYGAASGRMTGRIAALFYRYQALAGNDLVADFLIAPDGDPKVSSRPGDSGAVWHWVSKEPGALPRALAIQWGGHVVRDDGSQERTGYALATSLSNVCNLLEVDLITDWNVGSLPYWGRLGHYAIGTFAVLALADPALKRLMEANLERISFATMALNKKDIAEALRQSDFKPLADVPDLVWKERSRRGRGPAENPTHYADIDELSEDGKTLLDHCLEDDANVSVEFWQRFYDAMGHTDARSRGLLPFRVWQFFDAMVEALRRGAVDEFVCAAGILSHYVGDACQPLHGSFLNDGYKDRELPPHIVQHRDGTTSEEARWEGKGVHSTYEEDMLNYFAEELAQRLESTLTQLGPAVPNAGSGHAAAVATVRLMSDARTAIAPSAIVDSYIAAGGKQIKATATALWNEYGTQTADLMALGARTLACLWEAAWQVGGGASIPQSQLRAISEERLAELYNDKSFVRSLDLDHIGEVLS